MIIAFGLLDWSRREPHAIEQLSITQGFVQFDRNLGRWVSLTREGVSDREVRPEW
jgi:hypothetical protein